MMNARRWSLVALSVMAASAASLGGCVVTPGPAAYYEYEDVPYGPPPVHTEVIGVAPAPGYIWIGGYWGWSHDHYSWNPGRWEAPRPGYRWAPPRWEQHGDRWRGTRGRWERDRH